MAVRALVHVAQRNLVCSVCYNLFRCPVAFPCGHVFCSKCAERCIEGRPLCPLCNHAVSRRSASSPLPALVGLMDLVQHVAQSLSVYQAAPAVTCGAAQLQPLELTGAVDEAASTSLTSSTDSGTSAVGCTPEISRATSASRTQLLRTPPLSRVCAASDDAVSDAAETQCTRPPCRIANSLQQSVVVRRCSGVPGEGSLEHRGLCVLCGLDISDRVQMGRYLRRLLDTDKSCDWKRVRQLNEERLGECLGPMWDVHLPGRVIRCAPSDGRRKRGCSEMRSSLTPLKVHQSCLEWCLLRGCVGDGASTVTVGVAIALLKQMSGDAIPSACSFCSKRTGACLVPCSRCGRTAYHYPCALLTGSGVCDLLISTGALLCGCCSRRQQRA